MDKKYEILNQSLYVNKNIKDGIQNSILTILSGALVLSFSLLQYFHYRVETIVILKISWVCLLVGIISNILSRFFSTEIVRVEINKKDFEFSNPEVDIEGFFKKFHPERKYVAFFIIFSFMHWAGFILGLIGLLVFVWINQ